MSVEGGRAWAEERLERWRERQDTEALGELLKWQRDRAYAVALRILYQPAEAEDAVQQAFLKMFSRKTPFATLEEFQAAVYRMVTQASIDLLRNAQARAKLEKAMAQSSPAPALQHTARVENAEALSALHEECAALTPEDRALLALCCQEGQSLNLAAQTLDLRRETARDRLQRLLATLRQRLNRRGISLSLLLLIGLLQNGGKAQASEGLCQALNAQLPGAACQAIAPAQATGLSAAALSAQIGLGVSATAKAVAGIAAVGLLSAGLWLGRPPVAPAPTVPATPVAIANPAPSPAPTVLVQAAPVLPAEVAPKPPKIEKNPEKKDDDEDKIDLQNLPVAVLKSVEASKPGMKISKAERENKNGHQIFTLEGTAQGVRYEIRADEAGKILKIEVDREEQDEKPHAQLKAEKPLPPPEF